MTGLRFRTHSHPKYGASTNQLLAVSWACLVVLLLLDASSSPGLLGSAARIRSPSHENSNSRAAVGVIANGCTFAPNSTSVEDVVTGLEPNSSSVSKSSVSSNISSFLGFVCSNQTVSKEVRQWGALNTTIGFFASRTAGLQFINFTTFWDTTNGTSPYCAGQGNVTAHQLYWSLDLLSGTESGPHAWQGRTPSYTQMCGTSGQTWTTSNWAGYEFWDGSQSLYGLNSIGLTVPMTTAVGQQVNPPHVTIDSVGAAWVGLEDSLAASTGSLLQTGWTYDASYPGDGWCVGFSQSCDYGLWYEHFPSSAQPYSGDPKVSSGDIIEPTIIQQSNHNYYLVSIFDDSTGNTYSTLYNIGYSWNPHYAAYMVEAPPYAGGTQSQIADFSGNPIQFENANLCVVSLGGCSYTPHQAYSAGNYRDDQLNQENGVTNTLEQFVYGPSYWQQMIWYPEVEWLSSGYSYCYVNPGSLACGGAGSGGIGGGCVANGTLILTPTGYSAVQNLHSGSAVEEYNFSSHELVQGTLLWANSTTTGRIIDINHGWLDVTVTNQPIYIKNVSTGYVGWLNDPINLTTSDRIFDPVNGTWIAVTCLLLLASSTAVYDVVTDGTHSFVASGSAMYQKAHYGGTP